MKHGPVLLIVLLAAASLFLALAPIPVAAQRQVAVKIGGKALLSSDGEAVSLKVAIACPPGWEALEAFVYVVQDDHTSQFAGIPVTCDGKKHQYVVHVLAYPEAHLFHPGSAYASAYILLHNLQTGETIAEGDSRNVVIR